MSELRVDDINDAAGTGAPDFPNGLTLQSGGYSLLDKKYVVDTTVGSLSSGTTTDVTSGTLSLDAGTYLVHFGGRGSITSSSAPTEVEFRLVVTDSANSNLSFESTAGLALRTNTTRFTGVVGGVDTFVLGGSDTVKLRTTMLWNGGTSVGATALECFMVVEKIA